MCGIAGFSVAHHFNLNPIQVGTSMAASLAHRGGDDWGVEIIDDVCLIHSRLAIVDLSYEGHQPMISDCGNYTITFNGEIYNHQK